MEPMHGYYEYSPFPSAIDAVIPRDYSSLTPAKARRSLAQYLKGKQKVNKVKELAPVFTPNGQKSYFMSTSFYGHETRACEILPEFKTSNVETDASPKAKLQNGTVTKTSTVMYSDWCNTVMCRVPPVRPQLPSYFTQPSGFDIAPSWYPADPVSVAREPLAHVPVQIYTNVCLCPDQLRSTKGRKKKKCKNCGRKVPTLWHTTGSVVKTRPALSPSLYEPHQVFSPPPAIPYQYHMMNQHVPQNINMFTMPNSYSEVIPDGNESVPTTPETVRSGRSVLSTESTRTLINKIIEPPLLENRKQLVDDSVHEVSVKGNKSIIEDSLSAYEMLKRASGGETFSSDTDELSDNAVYEHSEVKKLSPSGHNSSLTGNIVGHKVSVICVNGASQTYDSNVPISANNKVTISLQNEEKCSASAVNSTKNLNKINLSNLKETVVSSASKPVGNLGMKKDQELKHGGNSVRIAGQKMLVLNSRRTVQCSEDFTSEEDEEKDYRNTIKNNRTEKKCQPNFNIISVKSNNVNSLEQETTSRLQIAFDSIMREENLLQTEGSTDMSSTSLDKIDNLSLSSSLGENSVSSIDIPPLIDFSQVKSILKRPNSVDNSSETDSDLCLSNLSEVKQNARRRKQVHFRSASNSFLLKDASHPREDFCSANDQDMDSDITNTRSRQIVDFPEKESDISELLYPNDQTSVIGFTDSRSSLEAPLKDLSPLLQPSRRAPPPPKNKSQRPSVPPPPPPSSSSKPASGPFYTARPLPTPPLIKNEFPPSASPSPPPPPLPLSPPPALGDSYLSEAVEILPISPSSESSSDNLVPLDDREHNIFFTGKPHPIFAEEEQRTATVRGRVKVPRPSLLSVHDSLISPSECLKPVVPPPRRNRFKSLSPTGRAKKGGQKNKNRDSWSSFLASIVGGSLEDDEYDRLSDHIYEELISVDSSCDSNNLIPSPVGKAMFEGASRNEILEYLQDAKRRVGIGEDDEDLTETVISGQISVDDDVYRLGNLDALSTRNDCGRSSNISSNSDSSGSSSVLRTDKDPPKLCLVERTDSGVGSETSKPNARRRNSFRNFSKDEPICEDCEDTVEPRITRSGVVFAPLVCRRCRCRRRERRKILKEILETEIKYGRDLKIIMDQFYRPIEVAGLLSPRQLAGIFLNVQELIDCNRYFSLQLKDAFEIAFEQGDEDLLTVNVGSIFCEAEKMLTTFEKYCINQGAASVLLQNLEKEKELLRILLRVSQMENTLLRRMNLHSFLMVPVQRVTKYPLLLSRLYKATPPSHSSKEDIRKARDLIEIHLHQMNNVSFDLSGNVTVGYSIKKTKDLSPTKLWRRISMSVGNGQTPLKRNYLLPEQNSTLKYRNLAFEVLPWEKDKAMIVREGRLQCISSDVNNWTRRGKYLKTDMTHIFLLTLGNPNESFENVIGKEDLVIPRDLDIQEVALVAFKGNKVSKSALIRSPWILSTCVVSWDSESEPKCFEGRDDNSTEEWFKLIQFHALSVGFWKRRRPARANIICLKRM